MLDDHFPSNHKKSNLQTQVFFFFVALCSFSYRQVMTILKINLYTIIDFM